MKRSAPLFKYERHNQPLLPKRQFLFRLLRHFGFGTGLILGSLAIGVLGYHFTENMPWLDSVLNASMILGGMGPVNTLATAAGKVFASLYALFSGVIFLVAAGVFIAPVVHRWLHKMHLDQDEEA
ncbi:MAG TPA: hypothetical protein PKZ26_08570 [Anaerolineaceae bacterium]|nr:MAG: hypothetical protein BWX68_02805 [Verrucomicrobia bacterium ADurb.Bin063]HNS07809.1 hypothetical protein [Anaerolineaceae bacterium]HNW13135.1 hypothetical protein [Anaerolineaceae bacterium]HOE02314.1 hypothetical protein [Anaerolineaceae bacterium]HPD62049.1 hypothetical protein [Anaerolineaceae bacterium]